jgi:hypothetical protein
MPPTNEPEMLPTLPFSADDMHIAEHWQRQFRSIAVRLRIAADHTAHSEVLEVGEPWPSPRHEDNRWMVWRDAEGVRIDDTEWESGTPPYCARSLDDALRMVWLAIEAERQKAIEAIPERLVPRNILANVLTKRRPGPPWAPRK